MLKTCEETIEALKEPVYVRDMDDSEEVHNALLNAWQNRLPYFTTGISHVRSDKRGNVTSMTVGLQLPIPLGKIDGETELAIREGFAVGTDAQVIYRTAFREASRLWGMVALLQPDYESVQHLIEGVSQ